MTILKKNDLPDSWITIRIDIISKIITGNTPSKKNSKFYGGDVSYFKPTDLNKGFHVKDSADKLSELGLEHARKIPEKSILVTCIGATIGKTGFTRTSGATNQQINSLIPDLSLILPEFLYYSCISPQFQESIIKNSSSTTLPIINKNKFSKLTIPLPPLKEQKRIVEKIEKLFSIIDNIKKNTSKNVLKLDTLRLAILKQAFEGKLVPQDPNDEPTSELLKRIKLEK